MHFLPESLSSLGYGSPDITAVAEIPPLYTGARLNLGDRVLGEVERNSFIALPGKGGTQPANALKTVCPAQEGLVRSLTVFKEQGVISSWTFF